VAISRELEAFLREVSVRAFRIARITLRDDADSYDAVQEAMIRMASRYADRDAKEWPPLFHAILRNCVHDEQRRRRSRGTLIDWLTRLAGKDDETAPPQWLASVPGPDAELQTDQELVRLERALSELPARQREAFLLRSVEELDVAQTAKVMRCSEGSVKTHYSRAVHALRDKLGES
jgi:RNA polymerase sigma-70 factor (ECF subfamily)